MKITKLFLVTLLCIYCSSANAKNIVVIGTGGTIGGAGDSAVGVKYSSAKVGIDKVVNNITGIDKIANIRVEQLMQVGSENMTDKSWLTIAEKVNKELSKRSVDGVVIAHGTDTIEETAYFLNLTIKSKKPVVIVGSMRPSTSLSGDGALNLYNAVAVAASDSSYDKGVLVMLNDEIHAARDVSKTHTTNTSSFKSPNSGAIGSVIYGDVRFYYNPLRLHTDKTIFNVKKLETLPKVEIIYAYAGFDPTMVDFLVKSNVKGIVVAGVGDGNINKATVEKLAEAAKKGIVVVRSAHLGTGIVEQDVEINDSEIGFVVSDNLNPKKARILTILALTKTDDVKKIREMFNSY